MAIGTRYILCVPNMASIFDSVSPLWVYILIEKYTSVSIEKYTNLIH